MYIYNLTGPQLVKKLAAFYENRKFITAITTDRHLCVCVCLFVCLFVCFLVICILYSEVFLNLTEVFLTLTEVFPCFFLSCKANARV